MCVFLSWVSIFFGGQTVIADESEEMAPTGLTLIICDAEKNVLDTVLIPKGDVVSSVKVTIPEGLEEVQVFALGDRVDKDIPRNIFFKGRPDNEKWGGLGFVEVFFEDGMLIGIDGNGYGPLKVDEKLLKMVLLDIKENKNRNFIAIEKTDGQGDGVSP